jgi:hypothetical protein
MKTILLSVVAFVCVAATCASADTVTFNFSSTTGTSTTQSYTAGGLTITATGTSDLFFKNGGGDETGLGLVGTSQNEITPGQSITFDLSSLFSANISSLSIALGSIQPGRSGGPNEGGQVCGAGTCISFGPSQSGQLVDITSLFDAMKAANNGSLTVTATSGNVLVDEIQVTTTVPEPNSLLLLGSGVFAVAGAFRKRLFN